MGEPFSPRVGWTKQWDTAGVICGTIEQADQMLRDHQAMEALRAGKITSLVFEVLGRAPEPECPHTDTLRVPVRTPTWLWCQDCGSLKCEDGEWVSPNREILQRIGDAEKESDRYWERMDIDLGAIKNSRSEILAVAKSAYGEGAKKALERVRNAMGVEPAHRMVGVVEVMLAAAKKIADSTEEP